MADVRRIWPPLSGDGSIRLLKLHSSRKNSRTPSCSVFTVQLDQAPSFAALSYCWGTEAACERIKCNGVFVPVTPNLCRALQRLSRTKHKFLWIDALCINQQDIPEKNAQVQHMGRIFEAATKVVIWLGDSGLDIDGAVKLLRQLARLSVQHPGLMKTKGPYSLEGPVLAGMGLSHLETTTAGLDSLNCLLTRPWFSRVWVVQEVVLNDRLVCFYGMTSFTWKQMTEAYRFLFNIKAWYPTLNTNYSLYRLRDLFMTKGALSSGSHNVLMLMNLHRRSFCGDSRDKIFGMNGIIEKMTAGAPCGQLSVRANYDATIEEVYTEFARQWLTKKRSLLLLIDLRMSCNSMLSSLPSWVPDWRTTSTVDHIMLWEDLSYKGLTWHAAGKSRPDLVLKNSSLRLKCQRLDEIVSTSDCLAVVNSEKLSQPVREALDIIIETSKVFSSRNVTCPRSGKYPTGIPNGQAYFGALFQAPIEHNLSEPLITAEQNLIRYADAAATLLRNHTPEATVRWLENLPLEEHGRTSKTTIGDLRYDWKLSNKLARTKNGYYCNVPFNTECGDEIALCSGSPCPLVIRPIRSEKSESRFLMVGACYVEGIMQGQAWNVDGAQDLWFD